MKNICIQYGCRIEPVVRGYDGNTLKSEKAVRDGGLEWGGATWECRTESMPVAGREGLVDLEVSFRVTGGSAESAGVGVAFEFGEWALENYILLPSAVYNGNDFAVWDTKYPPLWREPAQFRLDMPTTITPSPRLSADSARIEQSTGDTAAPCMGFYSPGRSQGFLVQSTQGTRYGNNGLTVDSSPDRSSTRFLVTAPCVRQFRQDHCKALPSEDRGVAWKTGDSLVLKFRLCFFEAPKLQVLFDRFAEIRKDLNPSVRQESLPYSAAWKIVEEKYNRDNWVEEHGHYKLAPNAHTTFEVAENPICFLWQLGWVGGGMMTLPMLAQGGELTRSRAWRNLKMIFERTQAPSGFFYGIGDGVKFYGDGFDRPSPHNIHLIRKNSDWLLFAIKHFDLFQKQGREIPGEWVAAIRKLADAFVKLWERYGQFGQYIDIETGAILVGASAAGAGIPAGLVAASRYYGVPEYLKVAEASARGYVEGTLARGLTTGGPGEILSAPDSESAFALLESLVSLLESTGNLYWAKAAHDMVRQCATWVVSYDYQFPKGSSFEKSGARTTGAVWANIQNKHGAPGICTLSGDSLFRLWRATGDPLALDLIRDTAHGITQYLSREDRPLSDSMKPGWMCERVNLSDWETAKGVGSNLFGSCSWAETAMMLTILEIPGLYVQPDTGFFCAFDNITAEKVSHKDGVLTLRLANPTKHDAEVKLFCETAGEAKKRPLGLNMLQGCRTVSVPAGGETVLTC